MSYPRKRGSDSAALDMDYTRDPGRQRRRGDLGERPARYPYADGDSFTTFRVLCPLEKVGSIMGKAGSIIKKLRDETGAKIAINDARPGEGEREVVLTSRDDVAVEDRLKDNVPLCPAQEVLLRVHAKLAGEDGDDARDGDQEEEKEKEPEASEDFPLRMLVHGSQVGSVLGKGGAIISSMRQESGANIRVLGPRFLPSFALQNDELLQITGDFQSTRKALLLVMRRLRAHPPKDVPPHQAHAPPPAHASLAPSSLMMASPLPLSSHSSDLLYASIGRAAPYSSSSLSLPSPWSSSLAPTQYSLYGGRAAEPAYPSYAATLAPSEVGPMSGTEVDVKLRVICPEEKVGAVIGKNGSHVRALMAETGAWVRVEEKVDDCEERVVSISATEVLGAPVSGSEEALLRVVGKITEEGRGGGGGG